jgi:hypothetical protein
MKIKIPTLESGQQYFWHSYCYCYCFYKSATKYAELHESRWCSQAKFLLV